MTSESITLAICRCALIASPDNAALRHQVTRLRNHFLGKGRRKAAAQVYDMLHPAKGNKEPPLVHSGAGE